MKNLIIRSLPLFVLLFFISCNTPKEKKTPLATDVETASQKKTVILAIDGGGIKGILPAYFLTQIEAKLSGEKSYRLFDVIGGTSTGGIISIGLTAPYHSDNSPRTAQEVLDFYMNDCNKIFYPNDQPTGPLYYAHEYGLEPFLQSMLGSTTPLSVAARTLPKKKVKQVFTTTYTINSTGGIIKDPKMGKDYGPYLFNWYDALQDSSHDYYLWEAARATSAAPTYFPVAHVGGGSGTRSSADERWSVDGGVMTNDPSVWAITEALRSGAASSIDDIVVVSLGCGIYPQGAGLELFNDAVNHQPYGQKYGFWGDDDWGLDLKNLAGDDTANSIITETTLNANQFVAATQLEQFANTTGLEYYRVQMTLPSNLTAMDNCKITNALLTHAKNYVSSAAGQKQLNDIVTTINNNL
ncbi:patatin-like phospholipase family protein [Aureisphaera galaxeae]|uniref:patatin-like phospholipase family protein n=1 Tax=Aureisphaera galaxeae TaxID=1538023 RepID=UPI00235098D6|nr:patatin-like phospholipase family protein [Aureisphaera galaxeae]MDC8005664.1 patatin-like phospholipase family protein [Aureisphaera galaxeae]